jgi:hypothetical protein
VAVRGRWRCCTRVLYSCQLLSTTRRWVMNWSGCGAANRCLGGHFTVSADLDVPSSATVCNAFEGLLMTAVAPSSWHVCGTPTDVSAEIMVADRTAGGGRRSPAPGAHLRRDRAHKLTQFTVAEGV